MSDNASSHRAFARLTALEIEQVAGGARIGADLGSTTMTLVTTWTQAGDDKEEDIDCDDTL